MRRYASPRAGFNLMELLVVVAIIGMLAAVGFISVSSYIVRAKLTAAQAQIAEIDTAIKQFHSDTGRYPQRGQLLAQLTDRRAAADIKWSGPYYNPPTKNLVILEPVRDIETNQPIPLQGEQIADPWGRPIIYIPKRDYEAVGARAETPFGETQFAGGSIWANANTFQLISAGPDGKTRVIAGRIAPLVFGDGIDNDGDGRIDEFEVKGHGTGPEFWPEDDITNF